MPVTPIDQLTAQELQEKTTRRLVAMLRKLRQQQCIATRDDLTVDEALQQSQRASHQIAVIKDILQTREHLPRKEKRRH